MSQERDMAPPDLSTLTWTTRAEVAAQLARYLRATDPPPDLAAVPEPSPRVRAAELLRILAVRSQRSLLRALALDHGEEVEVRHNALWALERLGFGLSGGDLQCLLSVRSLYGDEVEDEDQWFGTEDLLTLARRPDAQAVARRYLLTLSPEDRTQLLAKTRLVTPAPLMEWMYGRWLHEDRHLLASDRGPQSANQWVISMTRERAESRAVLQEMWCEAEGAERRELMRALHDEETEWEFPGELSAAETAELADALALPTDALVTYWGRERLLERFDAILLAEHIRWETRCPLGTIIEHDFTPYSRMLRMLSHWLDPELDEWIVSRAVDGRLHMDARWWLLDVLWWRNRERCTSAVVSALAAGDCNVVIVPVLRAARDPVESDRAMLREMALPIHGAELQYLGLCGLERLSESGDAWRDRLIAWTLHPEPRLRIRALGGLAPRGEPRALDTLLAHTEGVRPLQERAEAIAVLAEIDAPAHIPLFAHALAREESEDEYLRCAPAAEEAALALARLATPEALTALLRSYLITEVQCLRMALEEYLPAIVDAEPGTSPVLYLPPVLNWQKFTRYRWTESS